MRTTLPSVSAGQAGRWTGTQRQVHRRESAFAASTKTNGTLYCRRQHETFWALAAVTAAAAATDHTCKQPCLLTAGIAQLLDRPHDGEEHQAAADDVHEVQDVPPPAGSTGAVHKCMLSTMYSLQVPFPCSPGKRRCTAASWQLEDSSQPQATHNNLGAQQQASSPGPPASLPASHSREPGLCCGRSLIQDDDGQVVDALQGHHYLQAAEGRGKINH